MPVEVIPVEQVDDEEFVELQEDYEDRCNDVVDLQHRLRAAQLEMEQLRIRLRANCGRQKIAPPPALLPGAAVSDSQQRACDISSCLRWIAEHADLSRVEVLDVGLDVLVSGHSANLKRVVQWPLTTPDGRELRVSVPVEQEKEMRAILEDARVLGHLDAATAHLLAATWEVVPGELATCHPTSVEPAVLLANQDGEGILVATWPTAAALDSFRAAHSSVGGSPLVGERVEVDYEGQWYSGILHSVDSTGRAGVVCDVDAPGILTIAGFGSVRRIASEVPPLFADSAMTLLSRGRAPRSRACRRARSVM